MRIGRIALVLSGIAFSTVAQAQAPAAAQSATAQPGGGQTLAAGMKPSLDGLRQSIQGLHLDKWKGGGVRQEAERNISSIMKDLESSLPPLMTAADAAPGSVSAALPVERNLDALYAVVLRVFDAARVVAPGDQVASLQQAMSGLEDVRHTLSDELAASADAQQKQIAELQAKVKAQSMMTCPAPPPPVVCPAPKKPVVKKKPKPAASTPATPPAAAPAKPNPPSQ